MSKVQMSIKGVLELTLRSLELGKTENAMLILGDAIGQLEAAEAEENDRHPMRQEDMAPAKWREGCAAVPGRWAELVETSPSGKTLYQCRHCSRVTPTPDIVCSEHMVTMQSR